MRARGTVERRRTEEEEGERRKEWESFSGGLKQIEGEDSAMTRGSGAQSLMRFLQEKEAKAGERQ